MTIYEVTGRHNSGAEVKHHVGAVDVHQAIQSALIADTNLCRIDRVILSPQNKS